MFHRKSLKLAGLYLLIIMCISLLFSGAVYQLSTQELDRGLRRPGGPGAFGRGPEAQLSSSTLEALHQEREAQFQEAKTRVFDRLLVTNIAILFAAGLLSYYLAHRTLKPIEEANEALERFTADASHELRTPIAAMQSEIEVALMDPKLNLKTAKRILHSNLEELAKLTALSAGLLKLARQENADVLTGEASVDAVISNAYGRIAAQAKAKKISIMLPEPTNYRVRGDVISLAEALCVMLDNAIKYSPEDTSVTVSISQNQKQVHITIQDQGIGIKATELPHIFDRFYRADTARSKQQVDGYGIGLALAKHIIELHQGSIHASSVPGQGSTFTIHLPLT